MKKIFLTLCCIAIAMTANSQPLLRTHVETGDVEGTPDGTDLAVFKAIPYAAPPIGDLRWKAPQPAKAWQGVLKADDFAPWPPQPTRNGLTTDMMSEDCLYLGIATPAKSVNDRLPVMGEHFRFDKPVREQFAESRHPFGNHRVILALQINHVDLAVNFGNIGIIHLFFSFHLRPG